MRLHNTLTRKVEEFKPQRDKEVTLYTCGPTVYNYAHIGNLRSFVFDDTLRRTLEASGLNVKHTMNITDVGHLTGDNEGDADRGEDKLEKGAAREGKTVWQVAGHYTDAFKHDMSAMNILPPNVDPGKPQNQKHHDTYARATDFIDEQIDMVKRLIEKGFAYQTKQAIYFDVTKLPDYGKLSGQKLTDKETAARDDVVTDPEKHHPQDFAVWFFAVGRFEDHSMHWPSPWGDGFPGWHLECSAIIHATLGDPIDIHTGGVDHIGTHHPNEMAQTEAAFGHALAHFWIHNEFILIDGGKMSKSKGNAYTLKDITDRGFHPLALRLLFLQAHYRSELNFTWESLEAAQNALLNLYAWSDLKLQLSSKINSDFKKWGEYFPTSYRRIKLPLENDLNTPVALSSLNDSVSYSEQHVATTGFYPDLSDFSEHLENVDKLLGLALGGRPDITADQKHLIADRENARKAKDWSKADEIRNELVGQDVEIDDTPAGPRWRRTKI